ncbi:uncharacterized protein LOC125244369 [Megalobrama amblycephala]|uniref:uncharacterized protein LOC125244369 n=1 Tax=Megalobrama amblycephala TaxID=75352 RepID=UPI0020144368|nr:uncharacterized protein LOC125244369 [Megalobrama amblycephala]
MEIKWWKKQDLVCHYKDGQMTVNCEGRVSFSWQDLLNGNVSLTLRDVRRSQKGHYICEVIHESRTIKEYIFLHISSEDISLVVPNGIVSADPGSDVILPVHLSPETSAVSITVRWFRETELIYQYKNRQEETNDIYEHRLSLSIQELERGNLSLTLRNVQKSDSGGYTCKVFYDGCEKTGIVYLRVSEGVLKNWIKNPKKWVEECEKPHRKELDPTPKRRRRNSVDGNRPLMSDCDLDSDNELDTDREKELENITRKRKHNGEKIQASRGRLGQNVSPRTVRSIPAGAPLPPTAPLPLPRIRRFPEHQNQEMELLLQLEMQTGETPLEEITNVHTANYAKKREHNVSDMKLDSEDELERLWETMEPSTSASLNTSIAQENPGATRTQEQESESTEQERFSPAVQSQVQEREETSQSVTAGDTTQTPERPEDRTQ